MKDASGRSKGCGIVEYRTPAEAQEAINTLLDTELKGRLIFVREDREAAGVLRCGVYYALLLPVFLVSDGLWLTRSEPKCCSGVT